VRVLIHALLGGVGSLAVQLACVLGAEVSVTCSRANVGRVRLLDADATPQQVLTENVKRSLTQDTK
jgi:NADPH:quinone reductase-like Zn-dependent oxidoreductase